MCGRSWAFFFFFRCQRARFESLYFGSANICIPGKLPTVFHQVWLLFFSNPLWVLAGQKRRSCEKFLSPSSGWKTIGLSPGWKNRTDIFFQQLVLDYSCGNNLSWFSQMSSNIQQLHGLYLRVSTASQAISRLVPARLAKNLPQSLLRRHAEGHGSARQTRLPCFPISFE